jgi:hypothetical protein
MEMCGGVFVSAVSSKQNKLQIGSWKNSVVFLSGSWKMILVILIQIQITQVYNLDGRLERILMEDILFNAADPKHNV